LSINGPSDLDPELEGRPWLELRGKLVEPIRDVDQVRFSIWPDPDRRVGPNRPAAVAHLVGIRPEVSVIGSCAPAEFSYIWTLALSGQLTHAYMSLTKPRYNSAAVLSLSFSNELEE